MAKPTITPEDVEVFKSLISATPIDQAALQALFDKYEVPLVPTDNRIYSCQPLPLEFKLAHKQVEQERLEAKKALQKERADKKALKELDAHTATSTAKQLGLEPTVKAKVRKELISINKKINKIDALLLAV